MLTPSEPPSLPVSELIHNEWYDSQKMINLITHKRKSQPLLQYVFSYSGDDDSYKQFRKQFEQLITLKNKFKIPAYFISMRPGKTTSSHFIVGIMIDDQLIIINPLGEEKQKDFYQVLFKLKDLNLMKFLNISNTTIQRDQKKIVSCGPICVELFNYFASSSKKTILDMTQGSFTTKEIEYSDEDLEYFSLTNAQVTLAYRSIDISKSLPKSLIELLSSDEEEYLKKLETIREEHANYLPQKDMWPTEQSIVFQMMAPNATGEPEDMESFPELKKEIESMHLTPGVVDVKDVKEKELPQFEPFYSYSSSSSNNSLLQWHIKSKKGTFPTKDPAEEVFIKRWDRTSELLRDRNDNRWKRRLDSIARLIEGNSICAAIALENNSFLIATNTNFVTNSEAQGYVLINTVMSFFKEIANISDEMYQSDAFKMPFKETFRKICRESMSGLQLPTYIRDELEKDDFIDRVIKASKKANYAYSRELRDYMSQRVEYGHSQASHGSAFNVCVALMQDFDKVRKFIRENKNNMDHPPTKSFIQAIRNYQTTNIIGNEKLSPKVLNPGTREKMHAEMRILALIDNQLKNKESRYANYIGISKLCCLDCHAMIYAVNHANYNNNIEIRGAHNVAHVGNWNAPFNITGNPARELNSPRTGGLTRNTRTAEPFQMAVVTKFNAVRKTAVWIDENTGKKITGAAGVSEYGDDSQSSEEEKDNYYDDYCLYLLFMKKTLEQKKKVLPSFSKEISDEIEILEIGLKVYEDQVFKDICNTEFDNIGKRAKKFAKNDFQALFTLVTEKEQKSLVLFLQKSLYAGEKVSRYFSSIDISATPTPLIGRKRPGSPLTP